MYTMPDIEQFAIAPRSTVPAGFVQRSHPEQEDREYHQPQQQIDDALYAWLLDRRDNGGESNQTLAAKLGYRSGSTVSKYLNRKPEGNIAELESRIADLRDRQATTREELSSETFQTSVSRQFRAFCDSVHNSRRRGLLVGPAGIGKTIAMGQYLAGHPAAVGLTLDMASRDDAGIRRLLWDTFDHRGKAWMCQPRWPQIVANYRNSGRLLIVDQAQRLSMSGLYMLHDLCDATGLSMVLVGNPSILDLVGADAQNHRRTFQTQTLELKKPEDAARKLVDLHAGQYASDAIYDLAARSARRDGHLGLVANTLFAALDYVGTPAFDGDFHAAYLSAHAKSVHGSTAL